MQKTLIAIALVVTPAVAAAQSAGTSANVNASANASAAVETPALSAESQARIDARIAAAAERGVPEAPLRKRAAEGQAKGASESSIIAAVALLDANMQTAKRVFVEAGRKPSDAEVAAGGEALAQGATAAHLGAIMKSAPRDRSLEVALTALTSLTANGQGVAEAAAHIQSQLEARATDETIASHAGLGADAAAHGAHGAHGVTGAVNATTGAAAGVAGKAGSVTGSVGGAVGGAVGRKP